MKNQLIIDELDQEWVSLILTARKMGISLEEIRDFFRQSAVNSTQASMSEANGQP